MQKYPDAIKCLDDTIKISPKLYFPHHRKILVYQGWEKYSDAIKLAENLLKQFPKEAKRTIRLLMDICEETGDISKQKEWEKKLQEILDSENNETDGV